jgi:hypothetical protein
LSVVCREKVAFAKAKPTFFPGSILNPAARGGSSRQDKISIYLFFIIWITDFPLAFSVLFLFLRGIFFNYLPSIL